MAHKSGAATHGECSPFQRTVQNKANVPARNLWGYVSTNEEEVVEYVTRLMLVAFVLDDPQCVLSGK
jgi:hypothetical protein